MAPSSDSRGSESKAAEQKGRFRHYHGKTGVVIKWATAAFTLFCLLYLSNVLSDFRIYLLENQYNAIFLIVVMILTFLLVPAGKKSPRDRLPWYDLLFIILSVPGNLYIIINAGSLLEMIKLMATPVEIVLGAITILALAEALRRTLGWAMIIVSGFFIIYMKYGYLLGGFIGLTDYTWGHVIMDVYLSIGGIYGSVLGLAGTIVLSFVIFGVFFNAVGGGDFFVKLALSAMGAVRGGPAKVAIVGSALFGTLSGSPIANVMVTGTFTIPMMKKTGYRPDFAGAIETVASTGGAIMPPMMGIVAFVMAEMMGVTYRSIAIAAILPAVLYFWSLFLQVDLHAVKQGMRGVPRQDLPSLKETLREGWELAIPFALLVFFLFIMKYPAENSAIYALIGLVAVSMFRKSRRLTFKKIVRGLEDSTRGVLDIGILTAVAGVVIGVLTVTGLGPKISAGLVTLSGGSTFALVVLAGLASYVMGMGVSAVATYIILASLVAPALTKVGIEPMVSHFFIMYMGISTFFTPPFCPAAFVAATIADARPFSIGFLAMRLGIVCFIVPLVIIYNPALIFIGSTAHVIQASITAFLGVSALSAGMERYLFTKTNWLQTALLFAGAAAAIVPETKTDVIGIGLLAAVTLWQWLSWKKKFQPFLGKEGG